MNRCHIVLPMFLIVLLSATSGWCHFGMLIPSDTMVMQDDDRTVTLALSFSHPFEMGGMTLDKPKSFNVITASSQHDLLDTLKATRVMDKSAWKAAHAIKRPGAYTYYMEPQPYWEAAEDLYIIHYTKTVIAAFGDDDGWDKEIGLKTEIVPLSKPFGLYTGNVFQGIVKLNGKPVPHAEVEIEHYNQDRKHKAPTDYMITQTIKADGNGVFTYAAPAAGWWGFAGLNSADFKLMHNGKEKEIELGAVIWVHFQDMK